MQELNGYIKLFRKLIRWGWYQDNVVKGLFIHCLLCASYKDFEWMGQRLKAGQFITGRKKLAKDLGFSEQQIRTAIKKLESTGEITSKTTNKFTVITVVNWEDYQIDVDDSNQESNFPITNEQPTNNQQATNKQPHMKNIKNIKNIKKREKRTCARETPSYESIISFSNDNGLSAQVAQKFYDYYSPRDWMTQYGTDVAGCWQDKLVEWNKNEIKKSGKKNEPSFAAAYDKQLVDKLLNQD